MSDERYEDMYRLGESLAQQLSKLVPDMIKGASITNEDDYLAVLDGIHDHFGDFL